MTDAAAWRAEDELTYAVHGRSLRHVFAAFHPPGGVLALGGVVFAVGTPRRTARLHCYLLDDDSEVVRLVLDLAERRAQLSEKRRGRGTTDERARKLDAKELASLRGSVVTAAFVKLKLRTRYTNVRGPEAFHVDFDFVVPVDQDWRLLAGGGFHHVEIESRHPGWETEHLEAGPFLRSLDAHLHPAASKAELVRRSLAEARPYSSLPAPARLDELRIEYGRWLHERANEEPLRGFLGLAAG